jgi:hypothetical protein
MSVGTLHALAASVLYFHLGVVAFNIFWMVAVPLGAWAGWTFVRNIWWRGAHVASLVVVAVQAAFGRLCFLTIWQNNLEAASGVRLGESSAFERAAMAAIYWPLPAWAFIALYIAAVLYAAALWILVPPQPARRLSSV